MIIHSLSGVKGRLIFINRGCKSHLKNNTKAKRKFYLLGVDGGVLSCGTEAQYISKSIGFSDLESYSLKEIIWNWERYKEKMKRNGEPCEVYVIVHSSGGEIIWQIRPILKCHGSIKRKLNLTCKGQL